jgi:hypothetical protein
MNESIPAILEALAYFVPPHQVTELRVLCDDRGGIAGGFYDGSHLADMAREAAWHSGRSFGVYFVPNPLKIETITRRPNRCAEGKPSKGGFAKDADVAIRAWLLIDLDPVRDKQYTHDPSTDVEKAAALEVAVAIRSEFAAAGWPSPALVDSGNGYHIYYPWCDPESHDANALLQALARSHGSAAVKVDTAVSNLGRIMKVPGTIGRKGAESPERPFRVANLMESPPIDRTPRPGIVARTLERLNGIADAHSPPAQVSARPTGGATAYGMAALGENCREMAATTEGRNDKLNRIAYRVGRLIGGGQIERATAERLLTEAALASGLGESETTKTIASGFEKGIAKPAQPAADATEVPPIPWEVVGQAPPATTPAIQHAQRPGTLKELRNYVARHKGESSEGGMVFIGQSCDTIARQLLAQTGGWPKNVGGVLICPPYRPGEDPHWIRSTNELFAWMGHQFPGQSAGVNGIDWMQGPDKASKAEFHSHLLAVAERFATLELFPHEPPLPDALYMHPPLPEPTGHDLFDLVACFSPASDEDEDLILAAFMTLCWGGKPGQRPGMLIESAEGADGRGAGKSTLAQIMGELVGGTILISPREKMSELTVRLLSPEARQKRFILIDNLKSLKFSSMDIEALVTSNSISGRQLYAGEGARPNYFTWSITVNSPSLSKDLAQRFIPIHVRKPTYSATWLRDTLKRVHDRRWHIIADIIDILKLQPNLFNADGTPRLTLTRMGGWDADVLSKVPDPSKVLKMVKRRQHDLDDDEENKEDIIAILDEACEQQCVDPNEYRIFIPTTVLTEIFKGVNLQLNRMTVVKWLLNTASAVTRKYRTNKERGVLYTKCDDPSQCKIRHWNGSFMNNYDS